MNETQLDEIKKNNRENWLHSSGITDTDYMDKLIEQVWQEAYLQGKVYRDGVERAIEQSIIDQNVTVAIAKTYDKARKPTTKHENKH